MMPVPTVGIGVGIPPSRRFSPESGFASGQQSCTMTTENPAKSRVLSFLDIPAPRPESHNAICKLFMNSPLGITMATVARHNEAVADGLSAGGRSLGASAFPFNAFRHRLRRFERPRGVR